MGAVQLTLRCVLAAVFLVAAVGKLLDLDGSRRALEDFGVPPRLARLGGAALPVAELIVAVALLIAPSARWGALAALLLLAVFVAGVVRALARGEAPDCHCFGQIHSEPAGPGTLIRNAVLAAAAAFILVSGAGPSIDGELGRLHGSQVALVATSIAAAVLALAVVQLWSMLRKLRRELREAIAAKSRPGLPHGAPAPDFNLTPIRGTASSVSDLITGDRPTVLVFVSTGCGPCTALFPSLGRWQDSLSERLNLAVIFSGERDLMESVCEQHGLSPALAQEDEEVFELYALRATPSAVQIAPDGTIGAPALAGSGAIEALIRTLVARPERRELALA